MCQRIILLVCALGVIGSSVFAADLNFSQSYTGADLFNDASVSFPTRTPTVAGTSLRFGTGSVDLEKLFVIPIFPAGVLDPSKPVTATISTNLTRLQSDFDTQLLLGDGSVMAGFQIADNSAGSGSSIAFDDLGSVASTQTENIEVVTFFTGAGFPSIGSSIDVTTEITIDGGTTNVRGSFLSGSGNADLVSNTLDVTSSLTFVFLGNDSSEKYQINSLSIEVQGTAVPEPTSGMMLLLSGTLVLWGGSRRLCQHSPKNAAYDWNAGAPSSSVAS